MTEAESLDPILNAVGPIGRWQLQTYLLCTWISFFSGWCTFVNAFYSPQVDHWCSPPDNLSNLTTQQWKQQYIPADTVDGVTVYRKCEMYKFHNSVETIPCQYGWDYDHQTFKSTVIEDFNLVCDDHWLDNMNLSIFMTGKFVGYFCFGFLTDRFGRKMMTLVGMLMTFISLFVTSFVNSFWLYVLVRFMVGLFMSGAYLASVTLFLEMIGQEYRTIMSVLYSLAFSISYMSVGVVGYLLRNWRDISLAVSLPMIPLITLYWYISESPRWLVGKGRIKDAEEVLRQGAKLNNKEFTHFEVFFIQDKEAKGVKQETLMTLMRNRSIRKISLIGFYLWFTTAMFYYGLSLAKGLKGDIYMNFFLMAAVEIIGYPFNIYALVKLGRKIPLVVCYLCAGGSLLLAGGLPDDITSGDWLHITFTILGKFFIGIALNTIWVYTPELYPTSLRSTGIGVSSSCARIGAMIAPLIAILNEYTFESMAIVVYGACAVVAGVLAMYLPETKGRKLAETIQDTEAITRATGRPRESRDLH